jgi:hypothetical protein
VPIEVVTLGLVMEAPLFIKARYSLIELGDKLVFGRQVLAEIR